MTHEIVAAADGSALGNPGPAGWAWYIDADTWAAGGWEHGTNNMGELKAVLDLFEATAHVPERPLKVLCDSQYVINSLTKWMPGWKKKGWKKSDGKPVLNVELMKELDAALEGRTYTFEWVKGHSGHPLNEAADSLANAAAQAFSKGQTPKTGPGFSKTKNLTAPHASSGERAATAKLEKPVTDGVELDVDLQLAAVRQLEHQLASPSTYGSRSLLSGLLSEDLTWVTPAGRVLDRTTVLEHRERAFALTGQGTPIEATLLGEGASLLVSRVETSRGAVLRSSIWHVNKAGHWKLRYRQETAASPATSPQT